MRKRSLTLEVSSFCQANCIVCVRDKLQFTLGNMSQEIFEKAITEASEVFANWGGALEYIDLGGMGEPLIDAKLEEKLQWLNKTKPEIKVGLTTNGGLLGEKQELICEYVDDLKISNYGFSKKSFESVHRGSLVYEDVKNNIENFLKIPFNERPKVIMSFLKLSQNEGEEDAWREYWEPKCEEVYIWLPHNWAGYGTSHTRQIRETCRSCGRPGNDFTIRANGDVSACCWDFNRELVVGNILQNSFQEIYEGEILKDIIKMHRNKSFFDSDNICSRCDQIYDRNDALIYSSKKSFHVGMKSTSALNIIN